MNNLNLNNALLQITDEPEGTAATMSVFNRSQPATTEKLIIHNPFTGKKVKKMLTHQKNHQHLRLLTIDIQQPPYCPNMFTVFVHVTLLVGALGCISAFSPVQNGRIMTSRLNMAGTMVESLIFT